MPGILLYSTPTDSGMQQPVDWLLVQNSATGVVPPNAPIQAGDIICQTSNATLCAGTAPAPNAARVARKLLAADKTANYLQTTAAGIWGIAMDSVSTNSLGNVVAGVGNGGFVFKTPNQSVLVSTDQITGRPKLPVMPFKPGGLFTGRLDLNLTDFPLANYPTGYRVTNQFNGLLAGIIITTNAAGVTTYSIQPAASSGGSIVGATSAQQIVRIQRADETDVDYFNKVQVAGAGVLGCRLIFEVLPNYQQSSVSNVVYSAQ
jgi:hypothetical protein